MATGGGAALLQPAANSAIPAKRIPDLIVSTSTYWRVCSNLYARL